MSLNTSSLRISFRSSPSVTHDRAGFRPTVQFGFSFLTSCSFTKQVLAQLDLLRYPHETTAYMYGVYLCRNSSMSEWRHGTFLCSVRCSLSWPRKIQRLLLSWLKAFPRVNNTVIEHTLLPICFLDVSIPNNALTTVFLVRLIKGVSLSGQAHRGTAAVRPIEAPHVLVIDFTRSDQR